MKLKDWYFTYEEGMVSLDDLKAWYFEGDEWQYVSFLEYVSQALEDGMLYEAEEA